MKILITGTKGLAHSLGNAYVDHNVTLVSRSHGYDINNITQWGTEFLDYDCVFNCAYDGFAQVGVLEYFFDHWREDSSKKIISIGSRVILYRRTGPEVGYWNYRLHKQALQQAHDAMLLDAKCDMKLINPGPIDTDMLQGIQCSKYNPDALATVIKGIVILPDIKRVDLWV